MAAQHASAMPLAEGLPAVIQMELPLMHAAVLARRTGRRYATLVIGVSLMHLPGAGSPEDGLMRNRN